MRKGFMILHHINPIILKSLIKVNITYVVYVESMSYVVCCSFHGWLSLNGRVGCQRLPSKLVHLRKEFVHVFRCDSFSFFFMVLEELA